METFDGTKQKETYGQMMNNPYFTGEEINVDDYQVVRPEFYAHVKDPAFTLNVDKFGPNAACVRMLPDVEYVEILVSLKEKRLLLMPCDETVVTGFRWARTKDGKRQPTQKSGEYFVLTLCQQLNWNADYRYEKSAIRVKYSTGATFCVYSKSLIEGIRMIGDCLKEDGSFLFRGMKEKTDPAVSFPLDQACDPDVTDRGGSGV